MPFTGQHKSMKVAAAIYDSEPSEGEATEESTFAVAVLVVGSEGWPSVGVSPRGGLDTIYTNWSPLR